MVSTSPYQYRGSTVCVYGGQVVWAYLVLIYVETKPTPLDKGTFLPSSMLRIQLPANHIEERSNFGKNSTALVMSTRILPEICEKHQSVYIER